VTSTHAPADDNRPHPGDLVLAWDGRLWNISVHPGPPQLQMAVKSTAVTHASHLATRAQVAVWLTRDGATFTCEHARPPVGRTATATTGRG
jgi:hypothetical protein